MSESNTGVAASAESTAPVADAAAEADVAENFEAQADGSAEGERGELLPEAAAKVQEESRKALGKKKIGLKVNGRDTEYELDLDNDEQLAKYLQKSMAADEKFQEAATIRKQMQEFVKALKSDPLSILSHPEMGINIKELAERVINNEIEDLQKTPEQKRMEELERKLKEREDELNSERDAKQKAELARLEEQAFLELDRDIDDALKTTTLPKSPYVMKRIADALIQANELGYTEAGVKDIMGFVESSIQNELQDMFGKMPEEVIEKLMGPNLDRVRKAKVAKVKAAAPKVQETAKASQKKEEEPKQKISYKDFFRQWVVIACILSGFSF